MQNKYCADTNVVAYNATGGTCPEAFIISAVLPQCDKSISTHR